MSGEVEEPPQPCFVEGRGAGRDLNVSTCLSLWQ